MAQLAGVPRAVTERARELLAQLEEESSDFKLHKAAKPKDEQPAQLSFFSPKEENPAIDVLKNIEVDSLSPLEALTKLYELKRMAEGE